MRVSVERAQRLVLGFSDLFLLACWVLLTTMVFILKIILPIYAVKITAKLLKQNHHILLKFSFSQLIVHA